MSNLPPENPWPGRLVTIVAAAVIVTQQPSPAAAQSASDRLSGLRSCTAVKPDAERLACYDREAAAVLSAAQTGEVRIVERQEIERTRRSLFGFSLPSIGLLGSDSEVPDTLETTITAVRSTGQDAWAIQVAEGSVWQITNAPSRFREPKVGDPIVLKRAALGSFFIRVGNQLGVKGRRIQ